MKNSNIIFLSAVLSIIIGACSNNASDGTFDVENASLNELRLEKSNIIKSYDSIGKIIAEIDEQISKKDTTKKLPVVTQLTVNDTIFNHFIEIQGNVETDQNVLVYPEFQGMLTRIYVQEGQKVRKGQLLATIDDGGLTSQLAQLETQASLAKTTFERQERLWNQKIGSEIQYLQAKASMESSQSAVNQIKAQIQRTRITAPFAGEIDEIITNQGQIVAPGTLAVLRIINLSNMHIKASVPENYLASISKNNKVIINIPSLQKKIEGNIATVGNYINPGNRTFEIQVKIPNKDKDIKPNLIAKLSINDYVNDKAILIPSNIIQENARGDKFVYKIKQEDSKNLVAKNRIETGLKYEGLIEVLDGLKKGDTIVNEGALTLKDGAEIKIQ